ncbi:MAG: DsrE family protein [Gammaproteobacteria bacterium]|nr:DsrE family protein [Gammaproteobacteria bacterium]MCB1922602.1 DsrE family protein [Gammaproteobacteria bacterium]
MKRSCLKLLAISGLVGLVVCSGVAAAAPESARQKVVYHISDADPERQRAALSNIQNHLNDSGDDALEIEVVVQGDGVTLLLLPGTYPDLPRNLVPNATDQVQIRIENLKIRGVHFEVCASSLKRRGIDDSGRLFDVDADDIVPSGLAELVRLQHAGFTYIKP